MGTGAAVPGSTAEATHSPGTGPVPQGKASSPAGTQAALPGPPPPPNPAATRVLCAPLHRQRWPCPGAQDRPAPAEQPLVKFPWVCIAWARERAMGGQTPIGG